MVVDLTNGLVSYWKLDTDNATQPDSVGSNDGTVTNATFTGSGKINGGYAFDGTADVITIPDAANLRFTGADDFTINLWAKGGDASNIWVKRVGSDRYNIMLDGSEQLQIEILDGTGVLRVTDSTSFDDTNWYMVTLHFDSGTLTAYKDNNSIGSDGSPALAHLDTTGADVTIGSGANGDFLGTIDEIGIWSRALNSDERAALYNAGAGLQYPFSEDADNAVFFSHNF